MALYKSNQIKSINQIKCWFLRRGENRSTRRKTSLVALYKSNQIKSNQSIKSIKSNQIKCWFLRRGENRSTRRKTSRSRVENQQTQSTYDAGSGNRTRDTLVEGERDHHCANPAPQIITITYNYNLFTNDGICLIPLLLP